MDHRFFSLLVATLAPMTALAGSVSDPAPALGRYAYPPYVSPLHETYTGGYAELARTAAGELRLTVNVPCGTKVEPRVFRVQNPEIFGGPTDFDGFLEVVEDGSSQCDMGTRPQVVIDTQAETLVIIPNLVFRVPGFSGEYEFHR